MVNCFICNCTLSSRHTLCCVTEQQVGTHLWRSPGPRVCPKEGQLGPGCPWPWSHWVLSVFKDGDFSASLRSCSYVCLSSPWKVSSQYLIQISLVATYAHCLLSYHCAPLRFWLCFLHIPPTGNWIPWRLKKPLLLTQKLLSHLIILVAIIWTLYKAGTTQAQT